MAVFGQFCHARAVGQSSAAWYVSALAPVTEYPFLVGTAPAIVSAQYPQYVWVGGAGIEGTFEISGGTEGLVSFDVAFDSADPLTTAAPDGRLSVTFTPANNFEQHVLVVTGHLADGTPTDTTTYLFYVADGQ